MESQYEVVARELRMLILSGELRPGERVPSVREISRRWGIAIATATKVIAVLRDAGLVESKVGSGTVVAVSRRPPPRREGRAVLTKGQVLRAAVLVADGEGIAAVSMRRVAVELGVGTMSLYRHVQSKDELLTEMVDEVFGEYELPDPGPAGWRPKLELIARRQWELCRRHLWLAATVSFTRPLLVPNLTAQTEWTLRAIDGLGLPTEVCVREALSLHGLVIAAARAMADEVEAEQETGVSLDRWWLDKQRRADALLADGRFPLLAAVPGDAVADLSELFEYSLARHLDGVEVLVSRSG
ncbi:TetR/AcrR family transcriptional regulator C-terminal domain-containing protein [Kribbella solani]|uniref:TetR/AcrR family transcriptional regulator C-terminal domain-containing protein n=1 Tax=Kribbella solani TaxID=236067 RepID=UPI0029B9C941|nr:TetR/AcrR family transcriptional regulator C-terminal domain-containing protein [Kribbella solani]MDX2970086.1 TetR/AcrR family transcriptional regulator C-terminal domain-containing protein [Kribbella solani]